MKNLLIVFSLTILTITSCVSPKIHNALVSNFEDTERNLSKIEQENLKLSDQLEEINAKIKLLQEKVYNLRNDSIQNGNSLMLLQDKFDELNTAYDLLVSKNMLVKEGQKIGFISKDSQVVHFEIWGDNKTLNPEEWLEDGYR